MFTTGSNGGISRRDLARCVSPTAVATHRAGPSLVHLANFDLVGSFLNGHKVAFVVLGPEYPSRVRPFAVGIHPLAHLASPVSISAFNCRDRSHVRVSFGGNGAALPNTVAFSRLNKIGADSAVLRATTKSPDLSAQTQYVGYLLFNKPGMAIVRFIQNGNEIDALIVRVISVGT